jgi:hypothetical protein
VFVITVALVLALVLALGATIAVADASRADCARGAYDELRFGDVLPEVAAARRAGPLGREDDIELTRLEAYTYAVFEDSAHAIDAFHRLLSLDPTFEPRGVSPKIRGYFDEARRPPAPTAVVVAPLPPARPREQGSVVRSPWFWGGAGALVAVAGVGLWLTLRDDDRSASLGRLELP